MQWVVFCDPRPQTLTLDLGDSGLKQDQQEKEQFAFVVLRPAPPVRHRAASAPTLSRISLLPPASHSDLPMVPVPYGFCSHVGRHFCPMKENAVLSEEGHLCRPGTHMVERSNTCPLQRERHKCHGRVCSESAGVFPSDTYFNIHYLRSTCSFEIWILK